MIFKEEEHPMKLYVEEEMRRKSKQQLEAFRSLQQQQLEVQKLIEEQKQMNDLRLGQQDLFRLNQQQRRQESQV